ncbi:PAS domain S-box protein [Sulfurimonas sp.]
MKEFKYIGIGASAGGLEAFKELVPFLPAHNNYIYIIAQHLDPNKESVLDEILSAYTKIPVKKVEENHTFLANTINIIPPGYNLVYTKSKLVLEKTTQAPHVPTPNIDELFKALSNYKENALGILLSGSGHDGTQGIQAIKQNGGISIAQSPQDAYCKSMPQSAIKTGYIDYILPAKQIAKELEEIISHVPKALLHITELLREKEQLDIQKYKNETIMRRLNKRMFLAKCKNLDEYLHYLQTNPKELHLLYQNILIGVTEFFRDKKAFHALEKELLIYLKNKAPNYELRVWCIACSTGEEAYSLAIIIDKVSKRLNKKFDVHIFATDIDENALEFARKATYFKKSFEKTNKSILKNYFLEEDGKYQVIESIRSQIVFTKHNILQDPPFINQDIISCRNLLIYIVPEVQKELFSLFHYSLKEHGLLFLGSSESTMMSIKYFTPLNSEQKIYIKEKLKNPPKISSHYFSKHLGQKTNDAFVSTDKSYDFNIEDAITKAIFELFSPECIIIDNTFSIIYKKGTNPFLSLPEGFVTLNIIDNLNKELRYSAKKLLDKVFKTLNTSATKFIQISLNESDETFVRLIAYPFKDKKQNVLALLYFQKLNKNDIEFNINDVVLPNESYVIDNLTSRIKELQKDNHELLDELTISKENMQLLNEELQSSNEELQSSNEELETSNEELQSSNEELHASIANEQKLQRQLSLILDSTHDGIIGLDLEGRHTFVNKAALQMLGYKKEELIGKNAHRIWHHTKANKTHFPLEECTLHNYLIQGKSLRKEDLFFTKDGTPFDVEVMQNPIIEEKKVVGAVLSFHDITQRNRLKKEAEQEHKLADLYINTIGTIVMILNSQGNIEMINPAGCKILGASKKELIGKNFLENFLPKDIQKKVKDVFSSILAGNIANVKEYKNKIVDTKGKEHLIAWTNNYITDENNTITSVITSGIDITNEEKLSQKLYEQEHLYKLTFEEAEIGIAHASLDGKWIDTNEYMSKLLGYTKKEFAAMQVSDVTYDEDKVTDRQMLQQLLRGERNSYNIEKRYVHKNGNIIWVSLAVVILKDELGSPLYLLKIIRDISQFKMLMYRLEIEKNRFQKVIEATPIPIILFNEDGEVLLINKNFEQIVGYTIEEIPTINKLIKKLFAKSDEKTLSQIKEYYQKPTKFPKHKQSIMTKSGEQRSGILNAVKLDADNILNKTIYLIAIIDITDMQKKDELMIAQSRQAAMGDMLAMIAHQWRQPLSVISMVANNVQAQIQLQETINPKLLQELIQTLNEQTQYLSHTIDDFRNFFRPDKERELLSLNSIIEKLKNLVQKSLENNAITLRYEDNSNIKICTYQNQLMQVLINIINNAKDAIKEKNVQNAYISIHATSTQKEIILKICDNGGGIDESIKAKLGEPYVSTKAQNGTGLGIYMSKIIASKYLCGRLSWESDEQGSCFYIAISNTFTCKEKV